MKRIKLNLGCGYDHRKGYVNIDAIKIVKPDIVHDLVKPLPFAPDTVSHILAQDILEHFTKEDVQSVIAEMARVLRIGGTVEVRVPNVDAIIEKFAAYKETRNEFLYGTTAHTGVFGAHKVGFTPQMLATYFLLNGLHLQSLTQSETNYVFTFRKIAPQPTLPELILVRDHKEQELVATLERSPDCVSQQIELDVRLDSIVPFALSLMTLPRRAWTIYRLLTGKSTKLLLTAGYWNHIAGALAAHLAGVPISWVDDGRLAHTVDRFGKIPKLLLILVAAKPVTVLVPDDTAKQLLINRAHIDLSTFIVVPARKTMRGHLLEHALLLSRLKHDANQRVRELGVR